MAHPLTKLLAFALSGMIVAVTAGCGGDDDDNPPPPPAPTTAQIRAIHASANTPAVDVFVNGTQISQGTAAGQQTGFATVPSGPTRIQIANTGTPVSTAPIDVSAPLNSALRYTAVAVGDSTQTSGPERLQAVLIEDGGAPPGSDNVKLRVVHGAPGLGPVDVFLSAAAGALPAAPTFANLTFSAVAPASAQPAHNIVAGEYRIRYPALGTEHHPVRLRLDPARTEHRPGCGRDARCRPGTQRVTDADADLPLDRLGQFRA